MVAKAAAIQDGCEACTACREASRLAIEAIEESGGGINRELTHQDIL